MRLLRGAMVSLILLSTPAQAWEWRWPWASTDDSANKLFVEAVPLWNQYQALLADDPAQYEARLKLLTQVDENLQAIVNDFPESSLAVEMSSTGSAKNLNKADIEVARAYLEGTIECIKPGKICASWIISEALETAKSLDDDGFLRAGVLAEIAGAQAASGDISGAKQTIPEVLATAKLLDGFDHASVSAEISGAQAASGDISGAKQTIAEALETAKSLDGYGFLQAWVLAEIAGAQAASGDISGALETAKLLDVSYRASALAKIAGAVARMK